MVMQGERGLWLPVPRSLGTEGPELSPCVYSMSTCLRCLPCTLGIAPGSGGGSLGLGTLEEIGGVGPQR